MSDLGPASGRLRRPPWILVVGMALLVVVLIGLLVAVVLTLSDAAGDDEEADRAALSTLLTASDSLMRSLADERSMASTSIIGIDQTSAMPVADNASARQATDAAIADYETAVQAGGDGTGRQLDAIQAAVSGLAPLRQEVDQPAPADPSAMPQAEQVFDRYSEVIDTVLTTSTETIASRVDSTDGLRGVALIEVGWQQQRALPELMMGSLLSTGPIGGPDAVADLAAAGAELRRGQATVDELAADTPYEDAADQLAAELDEAGLPALVDDAMAGGAVDLPALFDVISASGAAWNGFLERVEDTMLRADAS